MLTVTYDALVAFDGRKQSACLTQFKRQCLPLEGGISTLVIGSMDRVSLQLLIAFRARARKFTGVLISQHLQAGKVLCL